MQGGGNLHIDFGFMKLKQLNATLWVLFCFFRSHTFTIGSNKISFAGEKLIKATPTCTCETFIEFPR